MKVAVTGSSGLIGTALLASLRGDGHEVLPVVRAASTSGHAGPVARWDVDRGEIDAAALEGVDAVVHLAGEGIAEKRWSDEQRRRVLESRSKGTALLAGALAGLTTKPSVLLSGSAVGFYGDRGDEVLTEASPPGTGFLAEVGLAWEAATAPAADAGIRVAHLRTGIVLDRRGGALAKMLPLFRFGLGGKMGNGRQWWSWITLADEIGAIRFLLDHDVAGAVNLTAPEPATNAELAKAIGRAMHRPSFVPVPKFGPKLLLGRELADALLFGSQRVIPEVLAAAGYPFQHPRLDEALAAVLAK
jgi:uncharacterized protein (TIGR01777 family)